METIAQVVAHAFFYFVQLDLKLGKYCRVGWGCGGVATPTR